LIASLFDKSFLQSLSVDDSVWFDQYFRSVACPIFFAETLADLAKPGLEGDAAQKLVGIIASKFPERHASPCPFHVEMARDNLMGLELPMDGRIPRSAGRYVQSGDGVGIVFDHGPEQRALQRWQIGAFHEVEQKYAAGWRKALGEMNLAEIAKSVRAKGINGKTCKTLADAKAIADQLTGAFTADLGPLRLAALALGVPAGQHAPLIERWKNMGRPALDAFAPYAAFVLRVEYFFQVALAADLISSERPSNRLDVAYLCYLPFCHVFVSSDSLHRRCAPLFLRADQQFIWGPDLKADLSKINTHFLAFPEAERDRGLYQFGTEPPEESLTRSLVEKLFPGAIKHNTENLAPALARDQDAERELVRKLKAKIKGPPASRHSIPSNDDLDMVTVESRVSLKRGQWHQLPKGFEPKDED
jgi:hypothetical protein